MRDGADEDVDLGGVLAGAGRFLGFGLGMAAVLVTLTLALAFFKQGLVKWLRRTVPYVRRAAAPTRAWSIRLRTRTRKLAMAHNRLSTRE